jgi:hypothetical protein
MTVTSIRTPLTEDAQALERLVEGLVKRYKAGEIRSAILICYTQEHQPLTSCANTTLSDEAYAIQLLQARLMHCMIGDPM